MTPSPESSTTGLAVASPATNEPAPTPSEAYSERPFSLAELRALLKADLAFRLSRMARPTTLSNRIYCALSPNLLAVTLYRLSRYFQCRGWRALSRAFYALNVTLFGCDITPYSEIGPGLNLDHVVGIVIHARLGSNACLHGQVVLGGSGEGVDDQGWLGGPVVGDGVIIGFGARILGHISIGDNVRIGATSLVIRSLPSNVVAMGNPARVVDVNDDRA